MKDLSTLHDMVLFVEVARAASSARHRAVTDPYRKILVVGSVRSGKGK